MTCREEILFNMEKHMFRLDREMPIVSKKKRDEIHPPDHLAIPVSGFRVEVEAGFSG